MNIIFLCGIIKENPIKDDKEISTTLTVLNTDSTIETKIFTRLPEHEKKFLSLKENDVVFICGNALEKGTFVRSFTKIGSFKNKTKAFDKLLDIGTINTGIICGEIKEIKANEATIKVERENELYYGDLSESDNLKIKIDKDAKVGQFHSYMIQYGDNKLYQMHMDEDV